MSLSKFPDDNALKKPRVPNAFMLFVKEQKSDLLRNCPGQNKAVIGSILGKKWRSMSSTEKQVYYDKYSNLKKVTKNILEDSTAKVNVQLLEESSQYDGMSNNNLSTEELSLLVQANMYKKRKNQSKANSAASDSEDMKPKKSDPEVAMENGVVSNDNNGISSEISCTPKTLKTKKMNKKPLNAFMVFSNEQRKKLSQDTPKGSKQCHLSRILGEMWKQLQGADKEKYFSEARRLRSLQEDKYQGLSSKVSDVQNNLKCKSYVKIKVKKGASKNQIKKPKQRFSTRCLHGNIQTQSSKENITQERKQETVSKPPNTEENGNGEGNKTGDIKGISTSTYAVSEMQPPSDPSNLNLYASSSAGPSFHPDPSSSNALSTTCHCHHSASQWLPSVNKSACSHHYPLYPSCYGGMNNPCWGSGQHYPFMPQYPMLDPTFWMYRQPFGLPPYSSPLMSSGCPHYNYSFPYPPYPGSYFSAYFPDRFGGQYPDISKFGYPFGNTSRKEDAVITEIPTATSSNFGQDRETAVPPTYSSGNKSNKAEASIRIESVCSNADIFNQTDTQIEENDDDVSLGSHSLVIVDDQENEEERQNPDVNAP